MQETHTLTYFPVTPDRWADFERLFGPNGACAGCWCAWWRVPGSEFNKMGKDGHKNVIRTAVQEGLEPGLLAYDGTIPAGWVALAPREQYPRLARSRNLYPVDDAPVWSITCFFIDRHYRRQGMMEGLIRAAVDYARTHGAAIVEAYPLDPHEKISAGSLYTGVASTFIAAGFVEVARRGDHPIMRYKII
ncbi:MAG: GNAT family N-acetyltransferase [Anaerolineaceae bacterium]|nr:GNAT family N-acetyltransferase [Anaerolineaceae bacterium]